MQARAPAGCRLPTWTGPNWIFVLVSKAFGQPPLDVLRAMLGPVAFDTRRVQEDLGLTFMPAKQTAHDMANTLLQLGIVPRQGNKQV